MDEVSWKVFQFYAETLQGRGVDGRQLVDGLARGEALFSRQRRWYDWDEHVVICERFVRLCGGPEAAERTASDATMAPWTSPLRLLARQFTNPRHIYWASTRLFSPYLYRHISFSFTELARDQVRLVIEIPPQYAPCESAFRMWRGAYRAAPRMLGLGDAEVDADFEPHRATYTIRLPQNRGPVRRAAARVGALFDAERVVDQLSGHLAQLRESYEALARAYKESEHVQRALLVAMPDVILRVARDGAILEVEGGRQHALRAQLAGIGSLTAAAASGAAWAAEAHRNVQRALAGNADLVFAFEIGEGHARRAYECRAVAVDEATGLCVIRDNTTQKQLEQQLRVSERMASLGTLAAGVAHEINNPLTYVFRNLEVLDAAFARQGAPSAAMRDAARDALHGATRIRDIVRGVKRFTRPETTLLEPTDVSAVVHAVMRVVAPQLRPRARVVLDLGDGVFARTNAGQLEQVLVNLLLNAVEAIPESPTGGNHSVTLRTAQAGDAVVLEVRDTGVGMSAEVQEHIFDPFFTTKPAGVGTGLGLSICHRIVSELEGSIAVESAPGKGALFRVTLPASARATAPDSEPKALAAGGARHRLLLVDDEVFITKTLQILLEDYDVRIANCGADAIGLIAREDFDVVLCDMMMPDMTGVDVYRHVLGERPGLAKRFIFMSGDALRSFSAGLPMDEGAWLEKPFAADALIAALERVIASHAGRAD